MRYNLYLLNYNNYYNRQLKKLTNISDYISTDGYIDTISDVNIDIQDDLNTTLIINYNSFEKATPNYLLIEDTIENLFTRWFVIECAQIRGLQFKLQIRRDVMADYFQTIKKSPCLLYKGYVGNDNVLVFNREQQEYNKIKTKELLIKDNTGIGYVVGFIGRDTAGSNTTKVYSTYTEDSITPDFDYNSLSDTMKNYFAIGSATPASTIEDRTMSHVIVNNVSASVTFYQRSTGNKTARGNGKIPLYRNLTNSDVTSSWNPPDSLTGHVTVYGAKNGPEYTAYNDTTVKSDIIMPVYNQIRSVMTSKLNNQSVNYDSALDVNRSFINSLRYYDNKICCINNVYYKCTFMKVANGTGTKINDNYSFTANIRQSLPTTSDMNGLSGFTFSGVSSDSLTTTDIEIDYLKYNCYLKLTQQNISIYTYITPKANRNHLIDAPYDMFVFPYSDDYSYIVNSTEYPASKNMAINLAQSICESSGSAVYDIQIVPYCPFSIEQRDWSLFNYQAIYDSSDQVIGYYFWSDRGSKSISVAENRPELTLSTNPSYKEITQLNKYILCSPDKNVQWEFNPAMNHGITNWIISYEYRPFSSYLKIEPEFNWLYGNSFYNDLSDTRGLVINSSYSLTQLNDAWANYLNNNKNFQQIFDTQINTQLKTYDLQNKAAWDTMVQRSINGSFGGGLYEIANLFTGGRLGSKADAVRKEQEMTEQIQGLTLAQSRDLFNYQLDNIKNQPDTIKKLTSINVDFRIFPFVEIYECTEQELTIFRDNIKYNGMTLMVTGFIENYLKDNDETFIQGTLIRFNEFEKQENDYTLVQRINDELNKGVYITKEV